MTFQSHCAIAVLLLASTAGCLGPGTRPAAPSSAAVVAPAAWRHEITPQTAIDKAWWKQFGDPVLTMVVEHALANNVDIAIATARIEEARAQQRLANAQRLPTLDGAAGAMRSRSLSPFGLAEEQTAGQPQLTASFDLDLFGRLAAADAATRATLLATQNARDTVRLAVATAAANGYITLRALDAKLAVAEATLVERTEARRYAKRRADAGYTSNLELRQAEAEYRATEQLVPQAKLAVARQENALQVVLGDVPGPVSRGKMIADLIVPKVPEGLPADILRRRPDIASAEQQIVAADRGLDSARAAFLPDIRLTGSTGAVLSTLLPDPVTIWSIGGSILAPIFQGGRLTAQADVAAARRDQAAFAYRRVTLGAFRDVEDGLEATTRTRESLDSVRDQRTALAAALRLATNRYNAGYAPYLDQLDAQRGLLGAELAVIQAQADQLNSAVALYQAMGGGWTP